MERYKYRIYGLIFGIFFTVMLLGFLISTFEDLDHACSKDGQKCPAYIRFAQTHRYLEPTDTTKLLISIVTLFIPIGVGVYLDKKRNKR